jgi:hypothetical protein
MTIEMRLSQVTRAQLDPTTRERLLSIERAKERLHGGDLVEFLFRFILRNRARCPGATAAALDEMLTMFLAVERSSPIARQIVENAHQLRTLRLRQKALPELYIIGTVAQTALNGISIEEAKKRLGILIAEPNRYEYSAYVLSQLTMLFDDSRAESNLKLAETKLLQETDPATQLVTFSRLYLAVGRKFDWPYRVRTLWEQVRGAVHREALRALSTYELVLLGTVPRPDLASFAEVALVEELLRRPSRTMYRYLDVLATSAFAIARNKWLKNAVRQELVDNPPEMRHLPQLLSEFAKNGVMPAQYLASHIHQLSETHNQLDPFARLAVFCALSALGMTNRRLAKRVFDELTPKLSVCDPAMITYVADAAWAFAICDIQEGTCFAKPLIESSRDIIEMAYKELDERTLMRLYRAALSAGVTLPRKTRNTLRRVVHHIQRSAPTPNSSEENFVEMLRKALPEAVVQAGGFVGTHHADALVEINGRCYDAELDGRVHEVFDLGGRRVGRRGADVLRDQIVATETNGVIRFTHDELKRPEAELAIRRRFGLAGF